MTTIDDKAERGPEVDLARQSAPGVYRLKTRKLVGADDVTPEGEFPEFGDFLRVDRLKETGTGIEPAEEQFIECPAGLAEWLVDRSLETGDDFRLVTCRKVDGEWSYTAEELAQEE